MRKNFLLMLAGMLTASLCPLTVLAQDAIPSTLFECEYVPLDGYDSSVYGSFRVSNNGKYAVASDESGDSYAGILWERESNSITYVNDYNGEKANGVILSDVANDGMMVGAYPTTVDGSFCWLPGYKYLGKEWVNLPLPENTNMTHAYDMDYCSYAVCVSSDSRVILGEVNLYRADSTSRWEPMLWFLDENGNVTGTQTFEDQDYGNQGFMGYDMTDDGSVIVGNVTSIRGDQLPTIIQDGVMRWIDGPTLEWNGVRWADIDEETGEEHEYYWEGTIMSMDKDGNMYYYYTDGDGIQHNIVENIYTGEKTAYNELLSCGVGGMVLGNTVVASERPFDMSGLYAALNVSDDGMVIAGCGFNETYYYNYPALILLSESPIDTSIKTMKLDGININRNGNTISISGDFDRAEMFNATGMQVASSKGNLDLSGMTNGMYIIKVSKGNTTKVYKIVK
ncbi:MAG: T9SS type A sorting domain-containing protein [Prevotella sp.]|nr:T9SS type A sorting domain-containing protein [Prevotella sp.]